MEQKHNNEPQPIETTSAAIAANPVLAAVVHFFKVRYTAKPFDIYREKICPKGANENYWMGYDGIIYYGHRWFVFFPSAQNSWWLSRNSR